MTENKVTDEKMEEAVRVALIEILMQPEYSFEWLGECLRLQSESGVEVAPEEDVIRLDTILTARLKELAGPVVAELSSARNIEAYSNFVSDS